MIGTEEKPVCVDIVKNTAKSVLKVSISWVSEYSSKYERINNKTAAHIFRMDAILNNFREISDNFNPYLDLATAGEWLKLGRN